MSTSVGGEPLAFWFGPESRRLAGRLHVPAHGRARAGVVICPPIGQEHHITYRGLRRLAERLTAHDFVVCRFDYSGTGDSAGDPSPTPVADWTADIAAAVDFVTGLGVEEVALVGLRIGAALAAEAAAATERTGPLVMWDPVQGRAFLREHQAMFRIVFGAESRPDADVVETLGFAYGRDAAADLGRLRPSLPPPGDRPALLLVRPGSPTPAGAVDVVETEDSAGFVDLDALTVPTPSGTLDVIAGWLDGHMSTDRQTLGRPEPAGVLVLAGGADGGGPVEERITRLGRPGLFAVVTEPAGRPPDRTVVFLNAANEPHFGPGRMWPEMARSLAAGGTRAVRFDFRGMGDSPDAVDGDRGLYLPEDIDDVIDVGRSLQDGGGPVALVGLCSGGYGAVEAALAAEVEALCLVNPVLDFTPPEIQSGPYDPARGPDRRRSAIDPRRSAVYPAGRVVGFMKSHWKTSRLLLRVPPYAWHLLDRTGLKRSAVRGLERLAARQVSVMLAVTESDLRQFTEVGHRRVQRLQAGGALALHRLTPEDHSLYSSAARRAVADLIADHVAAMAASPDRQPVSERSA